MKYPKESLPKKPTTNIADKKVCFFQTDKIFFEEVAADMGMIPNQETILVSKDILWLFS
jgi:dGTPase